METYAQVLNYAIPFFVLLIALEAFVAHRKGVQINRGADMISSLSSGVTNTIKDVLGLSIVVISYSWLVGQVALFEIRASWLLYVVAFLAKDFAGYWMHRFEHEINFLWNRHIVHHSSEEFNLSCALRQSISVVFSWFAILMLPAALLGVPAKVVAVIAPLHLFAQFWYHTRLIGRMGFLEAFLVTPSHHRVHHAMNPEYLDRNYGQILIIWDKLFGTFQEEKDDIPPVYGVKRPVCTWNPIRINFQHFWLLCQDAWHAEKLWDKVRLWFMPTGWRPADVAEKYPVEIVNGDFSNFRKFDVPLSSGLLVWSWFQLLLALGLMFHLFNNLAGIGIPGIFLYGGFIFAGIFSYTTLMDKSRYAVWVESIRVALGFGLIFLKKGDWFGLAQWWEAAPGILAAYLLISLAVTIYFYISECRDYNKLDLDSSMSF